MSKTFCAYKQLQVQAEKTVRIFTQIWSLQFPQKLALVLFPCGSFSPCFDGGNTMTAVKFLWRVYPFRQILCILSYSAEANTHTHTHTHTHTSLTCVPEFIISRTSLIRGQNFRNPLSIVAFIHSFYLFLCPMTVLESKDGHSPYPHRAYN